MLWRCEAIASFQGIVERFRFEAMTQYEDVALVLMARFCDHRLRAQAHNLILDQFDFGVLETLQIIGRKHYTLTAGCKLKYFQH